MVLIHLIVCLIHILGIKSDLAACRQTFGAHKYDLNQLSRLTITGQELAFGYVLTPCGLVATSQCGNNPAPFEQGMTGCEKLEFGPSESEFESALGFLDGYGKTPNIEFVENTDGPGTGVIMTMRNADCHGRPLIAKIIFICDESVKTPKTMDVREYPSCEFTIKIRAAGACPISSSVAGGTVFIIIVLVLIVVYLAGGVLYNRFKHNETGLAMLPHRSFWLDLSGLFLSGCRITWNFVRTCGKESSYTSV